jgi:hypothetical protein
MPKTTITKILSELEPLKKEFDNRKIKSERFEFIFKRADIGVRQGRVKIKDLKSGETFKTTFGVNIIDGVDYVGINLLSKKLPSRLQAGIIYEPKEKFIKVLELL